MVQAAIVVAALVVAVIAAMLAGCARRDAAERFFTTFTQDEPTRPWVAYTGTPPLGTWGNGVVPWAEAIESGKMAGPQTPSTWWGLTATRRC